MAIVPIGSPGTSSQSAFASTIPVPAGTQEGDFVLASIVATTSLDFGATPAPFDDLSAAGGWASRFTSICYGFMGPSIPASYTFPMSGGGEVTGVLRTYRGVDPFAPINDWSRDWTNSNVSPHVVPSIDTTVDDCLLVGIVGCVNRTQTPPGSMTERWDIFQNIFGNDVHQAGAEEQLGAAGSTGTRTFTPSGSSPWGGFLIALTPAPEVGGGFILGNVQHGDLVTEGWQ